MSTKKREPIQTHGITGAQVDRIGARIDEANGRGRGPAPVVAMAAWNGVPVPQERRDEWILERVENLLNKRLNRTSSMSGDTMIIVSRDEDGTIEVLDLFIRRRGRIEP